MNRAPAIATTLQCVERLSNEDDPGIHIDLDLQRIQIGARARLLDAMSEPHEHAAMRGAAQPVAMNRADPFAHFAAQLANGVFENCE